jgi:hypothetical protein
MSKYLDLDDVVSGNPVAEKDLALLRGKLADLERKYFLEAHLRKNAETSYSALYNLNSDLRAALADREAEIKEARRILYDVQLYLRMTSPNSLKIDAFQRYPKMAKLYKTCETYLAAHPEPIPE